MAVRHPLPYAFAKAQGVLLECDGPRSTLWASLTVSPSALSEVMRVHAVDVIEHEAPDALSQRIAAAYAGGEGSAAAVVGEVESAVDLSRMMQDLPAVEDLLESSNDAPIIRMLNALLTQAAKDGASDIHIEPYERSSAVRFRVDGTLREVVQPNKALHAALISRLKIMAELDIAEKRLPQDGMVKVRVGEREIDIRVSTVPVAFGEKTVMRILDPEVLFQRLDDLGFARRDRVVYNSFMSAAHGIVLVTGPTGSGKSTTLYSTLKQIATPEKNIITVEDPVEMVHEEFNQIAVQQQIDITFSSILRNILRQDPDIIMIGEIRDLETATHAVQAALTGHLVFSTLHTQSAASTVNRLVGHFPPDSQEVVRQRLADILVATISLRLINDKTGEKVLPVVEIMRTTTTIQACIREGRFDEIEKHIENGRTQYQMQSLDQHLVQL